MIECLPNTNKEQWILPVTRGMATAKPKIRLHLTTRIGLGYKTVGYSMDTILYEG